MTFPVLSREAKAAVKKAWELTWRTKREHGFCLVMGPMGVVYPTPIVRGTEHEVHLAKPTEGFVASFHTHPPGTSPRASAVDNETAEAWDEPLQLILGDITRDTATLAWTHTRTRRIVWSHPQKRG